MTVTREIRPSLGGVAGRKPQPPGWSSCGLGTHPRLLCYCLGQSSFTLLRLAESDGIRTDASRMLNAKARHPNPQIKLQGWCQGSGSSVLTELLFPHSGQLSPCDRSCVRLGEGRKGGTKGIAAPGTTHTPHTPHTPGTTHSYYMENQTGLKVREAWKKQGLDWKVSGNIVVESGC